MVWVTGIALGVGVGCAGTGGDGGGAGTAGNTGGENSGGAPGTGATGASPGSGGDGPASGGSPASADDLVRAAVVLGSCIGDDGINRTISVLHDPDTYTGFWSRYGLQAHCLATVGGGCDAVSACLGYDVLAIAPGETCEPCVGSVASYCGDAYRATLDCATMGAQCDPAAGCTFGAAEFCDPDTFTPTCSGDGRPLNCRGTVTVGPDCASFGLACADGYCQGTDGACGTFNDSTDQVQFFAGTACSGTVLEACVAGGRATRDCSTLGAGFSCQNVDDVFFCGVAAECIPGDIPPGSSVEDETCEGNEVLFCNAGRLERVDCTALGFAGCDVTSDYSFGCVPNLAP